MKINLYKNTAWVFALLLIVFACSETKKQQHSTSKELISKKVSELYNTRSVEELHALTYEEAFGLFTEEELETLASAHWTFNVNVPVVVSVIRSKKQERLPFWLKESGFVKTEMTMHNEMTDYEVWQKNFV